MNREMTSAFTGAVGSLAGLTARETEKVRGTVANVTSKAESIWDEGMWKTKAELWKATQDKINLEEMYDNLGQTCYAIQTIPATYTKPLKNIYEMGKAAAGYGAAEAAKAATSAVGAVGETVKSAKKSAKTAFGYFTPAAPTRKNISNYVKKHADVIFDENIHGTKFNEIPEELKSNYNSKRLRIVKHPNAPELHPEVFAAMAPINTNYGFYPGQYYAGNIRGLRTKRASSGIKGRTIRQLHNAAVARTADIAMKTATAAASHIEKETPKRTWGAFLSGKSKKRKTRKTRKNRK